METCHLINTIYDWQEYSIKSKTIPQLFPVPMYVFKIDIFACHSLPINTRQLYLKNPALDVFIFIFSCFVYGRL